MTKLYVLYTSVLISNPYCLDSFPNENIVIPTSVLNELDKIKTHSGDAGRNARIFIRILDDLSNSGDIQTGVETDKNTTIQINIGNYDCSKFGTESYVDNKILACAATLNEHHNVTVVSNDINMRVRAKAFGMSSQGYDNDNKGLSDLYSGARVIYNTSWGTKLKKSKMLHCDGCWELEDMAPNECVFFKDQDDEGVALGRRIKNSIKLIPVQKPWGLSSNNIEQAFAIDLLLDPKVPLVTLSGKAGTGKTLVAVACGLESVINHKQYNNLIIYRPIQPVGTDMGYLPGELADKLEPWMAAIHDSMDFLTTRSRKNRKNGNGNGNYNGWKNTQYNDKIKMEALTYIRGRSIANAFILMDETQNVSKEEIKTILTRVGNGTKIVLTGDIEQIDNNHLDAMNNGLTYIINKFKDSSLSGHVTLTQGERSLLATEAADIL